MMVGLDWTGMDWNGLDWTDDFAGQETYKLVEDGIYLVASGTSKTDGQKWGLPKWFEIAEYPPTRGIEPTIHLSCYFASIASLFQQ